MRRVIQLILIVFIKVYRLSFSRILPPVCRFHPSCSQYALEAIRIHGPFKGFKFAVARVCKCNPFFEGGEDEVPAEAKN